MKWKVPKCKAFIEVEENDRKFDDIGRNCIIYECTHMDVQAGI